VPPNLKNVPPPIHSHMWRKHAKTKAHIYAMYVNFWELIVAFPNGGQGTPFSKLCHPLGSNL